ncbi:MAG: hypothetical protein KC766_32815 [Myxococcales bacterium]|nr:hypothetical protein [Myxococcales bacterium]
MPLTPLLRAGCILAGSGFVVVACGGLADSSNDGSSSAGGTGGSSGGLSGSAGVGGTVGGSVAGGSGGFGGSGDASAGNANDAGDADAQVTEIGDALVQGLRDYEDELCTNLGHCCADLGKPFTESGCRELFENALPDLVSQISEKLGQGLELDTNAFEQCVAELEVSLKTCDPELPDACRDYWKGKLSTGDPCDVPEQCANVPGKEVDCSFVGSSSQCVVKYHAGAGESCVWSCDQTDASTSCNATNIDSADQGRCYTTEGLHCQDGVCKPNLGPGAYCHSNWCAEGLYCDDPTDSCVARDAPCGGDGITPACSADQYCKGDVCIPKEMDGADCKRDDECASGSCGYYGCNTGVYREWTSFCR